jgi:hypothetical protein
MCRLKNANAENPNSPNREYNCGGEPATTNDGVIGVICPSGMPEFNPLAARALLRLLVNTSRKSTAEASENPAED